MSAENDIIKMLVDDNRRMRNAGCALAEAAFRVATEYDGVHRLMLGVEGWANALASEGGRAMIHKRESEESK